MYATWRISQNDDGTYSGPHDLLNANNIQLETIYSTSMPETYLSFFIGDVSSIDLSKWQFEILTAEEAKQFVESTSLPDIDRDGSPAEIHSTPQSAEIIISKII